MTRLWVRVFLFGGTIAPLILLQGIVEGSTVMRVGGSFALPTALLATAILLVVLPVPLLAWMRRNLGERVMTITETKLATPDLALFLLAYLLPVIGFNLHLIPDALALGLLLLLVGVVYTRGGLVHVQPVLFILGYDVYECKRDNGEWCWIMTKDAFRPGLVSVVELERSVYATKSRRR